MKTPFAACFGTVVFLLSGTIQVAGEPMDSTTSITSETLKPTAEGEMSEQISEENETEVIEAEGDVEEETISSEMEQTIKPLPLSGNIDTVNANEVTEMDNTSLLEEGRAKKSAGAALISVGGIFIGGAMVYTVMFLVDEQKFGIPLGSSTSGNMMYSFYLNPGIFAVPIGAPCLALGIVNVIKGKKMINSAQHAGGNTPLRVTPYLSYSPKRDRFSTGLVARF